MRGKVSVDFYLDYEEQIKAGTEFSFDAQNINSGRNILVLDSEGKRDVYPKDRIVADVPETPEEILYLNSFEKELLNFSKILILEVMPSKLGGFSEEEFNCLVQTVLFPGEGLKSLYKTSYLEGGLDTQLKRHIYRNWIQNIAVEAGIEVCRIGFSYFRNSSLMAEISYPGTDKEPQRKYLDYDYRVKDFIRFVNDYLIYYGS